LELIPPIVQQYAERFTSPEDELKHSVAEHTYLHHPHAQMLSGHLQGRLLEMVSCMVKPAYILEIGTFTGYSGLCLAQGLIPGGQLHTIELREDDGATARTNFNRSDKAGQIILHIGNALEIIPTLPFTWDLVFIDADKVGYIDYYEMVLPLVRPGGFILADNVLYHGDVLESPVRGKNPKAIHAFNERVAADERVEQLLLTVRDGLLLIQKK
jgi:caffeoyl-CoA O-methyltransferase